jgi:hypothetical protein
MEAMEDRLSKPKKGNKEEGIDPKIITGLTKNLKVMTTHTGLLEDKIKKLYRRCAHPLKAGTHVSGSSLSTDRDPFMAGTHVSGSSLRMTRRRRKLMPTSSGASTRWRTCQRWRLR